ncbi:MAG: hypothetical protein ABSG96_27020 [Terracidiphilus sp.]|jgi:hypothetical protein
MAGDKKAKRIQKRHAPARSARPGDREKKILRAEMGWLAPTARRPHHGLPPEILGIGYGAKRRGGVIVAPSCIRVYVREKIHSKTQINPRLFIKPTISGIPTDVIELRSIVAHQAAGESIGTDSGNIGTLGCLLTDGSTQFLLSNNHVLANLNQGNPGDPIFMPSRGQIPTAPTVALLRDFSPISLDGSANRFDAAIATLVPGVIIDPAIDNIGTIAVSVAPPDQVAVTKGGAASGQTTGVIDGINEDVQVMYNNDPAQTAHFTGQIAIVGDGMPFSSPGDSGALVVTNPALQPIGLLIGGSIAQPGVPQPHAFASPIQLILDRFHMTIVTA